jgi:hypothetical protein
MDSFSINSIKSYDAYLDIHTILNKKSLNDKVVNLVKYYNFGIKFVFIEHHMRKFNISAGSSQKPAVMTQYHGRFMAKTGSDDPNVTNGWSSLPAVKISFVVVTHGRIYSRLIP